MIEPVDEQNDINTNGGGDPDSVCMLKHGFYPSGLNRQAEALVEDGFRVHVICLRGGGEPKHEISGGVEIHRLQVGRLEPLSRRGSIGRYLFDYNAFFLLASLKLMSLDIKHGFRAVQVNTLPDYLVFTALIPKLAGAKVVLHMQEPMPELFNTLFDGWYRRPFVGAIELIEKYSLKFADRVVTVTREMRDNLGRRGADVNKVAVIVNVPDERIFRVDRYGHLAEKIANIKKEERRAGKFRVVYHGAIEERDGIDVMIRAAAALKSEIPGIEFIFMGDGDYLPGAKSLASDLKAEGNATFLGDVSFDVIIEEILTADVAVVPAKKSPFTVLVHPKSLYHYLAMQRPVVASRLDSMAAYFPEDAIVYFEPGDDLDLAEKLKFVFAHPEEMAARIEHCSQVYETYRWAREKRKYLGAYHSLLSP
jgi:glycosyltransferase involved in cell wall biosynthesis